MSNQKTGFNFLAFLFPSMYYAGKNNFKRGLLLAFFGSLPFTIAVVPFYAGFKANKELNYAGFKWGKAFLALFIHMMMVGTVLAIKEGIQKEQAFSARPDIEEAAQPIQATTPPKVETEVQPIEAPAVPEIQTIFQGIVIEAQKKAEAAENDMQKGGFKAERDKALCEKMLEVNVTDWIGTVDSIDANSDGKGILEIKVTDNISVTNLDAFGAYGGHKRETILEPSSEVFQVVSKLKSGQRVRFSGNFYKDGGEDCLSEGSVTLDGKLKEPEFIFKYLKVEAI
jgi:hypothetical protein